MKALILVSVLALGSMAIAQAGNDAMAPATSGAHMTRKAAAKACKADGKSPKNKSDWKSCIKAKMKGM